MLMLAGCATEAPKEVAKAEPPPRPPITVQDVNSAQQGWCDALLSIAKAKAEGGDYKTIAVGVLENNYDFVKGRVLFNPTLTFGEQTFRNNKEGAASYFIGGNPAYPNDAGFALKPWVGCKFDNGKDDDGVLIDGDFAATMGNVHLTDKAGKVTTVDKFWLFKRGDDGKLRIVVHKSSLPNPVPPGKR
jgi:hypothetical protein